MNKLIILLLIIGSVLTLSAVGIAGYVISITGMPTYSNCMDSDGGRIYAIKGFADGINWNNPSARLNLTDRCIDGRRLMEYFCGGPEAKCGNQCVIEESYPCEWGCSNGACNSQPKIEKIPPIPGLLEIKNQEKQPVCANVNMPSEGWYTSGSVKTIIKLEPCKDCITNCGGNPKGWYSSCTGLLILEDASCISVPKLACSEDLIVSYLSKISSNAENNCQSAGGAWFEDKNHVGCLSTTTINCLDLQHRTEEYSCKKSNAIYLCDPETNSAVCYCSEEVLSKAIDDYINGGTEYDQLGEYSYPTGSEGTISPSGDDREVYIGPTEDARTVRRARSSSSSTVKVEQQFYESVCGDKFCDEGEDCCSDCGCPEKMKCINNICEKRKSIFEIFAFWKFFTKNEN